MRDKLIKLRESRNLTQDDVASKLGISRSFYGHIETGTRNPSYGLARAIASLLGGQVDDIFFDSDCYRLKPFTNQAAARDSA